MNSWLAAIFDRFFNQSIIDMPIVGKIRQNWPNFRLLISKIDFLLAYFSHRFSSNLIIIRLSKPISEIDFQSKEWLF